MGWLLKKVLALDRSVRHDVVCPSILYNFAKLLWRYDEWRFVYIKHNEILSLTKHQVCRNRTWQGLIFQNQGIDALESLVYTCFEWTSIISYYHFFLKL